MTRKWHRADSGALVNFDHVTHVSIDQLNDVEHSAVAHMVGGETVTLYTGTAKWVSNMVSLLLSDLKPA